MQGTYPESTQKEGAMGKHIDSEGRFQSDRYPGLPPDHLVLSFHEKEARHAIYVYCTLAGTKRPELVEDITKRIEAILREEGRQGRLIP